MRSYKIIVAIVSLSVSFLANGQQDPNYTFYMYNMNLINPAFAGSDGTEIGLSLRSQWSGVDGAPETQGVFASHCFENKVGLGVSLINDKTFVENQTSLALDFSYRIRTGRNSSLRFGIKGSFNSYDVNLTGLETISRIADPSLISIDGRFTPNLGVGVLWKLEKFFLSISAPKLLTNDRISLGDDTVTVNDERVHLYLSGGYEIGLGKKLLLRPSVLVRRIEDSPTSVDLTAIFEIAERLELGTAYRLDEGFSGLFVFRASKNFKIGYAFEMWNDGPIREIGNGTHEIFLRVGL
jgi:type IX secretion system PorP/SprF family membrane protein